MSVRVQRAASPIKKMIGGSGNDKGRCRAAARNQNERGPCEVRRPRGLAAGSSSIVDTPERSLTYDGQA